MFNEIIDNLEQLLSGRQFEDIRSYANFMGSILEENYYIARVYILALINLGKTIKFDQNSVIMIRKIMNSVDDAI